MSGYIGSNISITSSGTERIFEFTATEGQTLFQPVQYTRTLVHVYQNGVRLIDGTDYTAATGTSITLTTPATAGHQIVVVSNAAFSPADTFSRSESDVRFGRVYSQASFPGSPNLGDEVWRTDLEAFFKFNGTVWIEI